MAKKKLFGKRNNVVKGTKAKKPFYKKIWFWVILVIAATALSGGDEETGEPSNEPEQTEVATDSTEPTEAKSEDETIEEEEVEEESEPTYSNIFEEKATEVFGNNLQDVEVYEESSVSDNYISITSNLSGGWNEKTMRDSFYYDVVEFLSSVEAEEFDRILFNATAEMVDQYGNAEEMKVITVNMTKDIVDKINFDNFQANNLPNVADAMFVHPAFQD